MNLAPIPTADQEAPIRVDGWRVGDWQVDARANEIWRGAEKVRLEPKVMQVLCYLAGHPGTVVSREELEAAAWPRMVVTTDAVTGTIIKLADGITEDLTTHLSKLSGLRVLARDSALAYKDSREDARRIAEQLGVDYLLKGSVQRFAGRVRINARLIDGGRGGNLWAERYDRKIQDIFAIQDEIAEQIVAALAVEIAPADRSRITRHPLASVQAYGAFLRGLDFQGRRSRDDVRQAIEHYQRAIALDPGFARAYAGLATVYMRDVVDGWDLAQGDALDQAAALTETAKRLDPSVHQIYFVDGFIELFRRDYEAAIRNAENAIAINPNYADGHALLAWTLHFAGRPRKGLASMEGAVLLNPRVPAIYLLVRGALHYSMAALHPALADFEAAVEISPSYQLLRTWLAAAYAGAGRLDEAQWEAQEILALDPSFSIARIEQAFPTRDLNYREQFVSDLRRAGLPE